MFQDLDNSMTFRVLGLRPHPARNIKLLNTCGLKQICAPRNLSRWGASLCNRKEKIAIMACDTNSIYKEKFSNDDASG